MVKYRLYIGLNDADRKKQVICTRKALKIISDAVCLHTGGGTVWKGMGIYTHDNGCMVKENTVIVETVTDNIDAVLFLMDYLRLALNQESILIEAEGGLSVFYERRTEDITAITTHHYKGGN